MANVQDLSHLYSKFTAEAAVESANALGSGRNYMKLKDGGNVVRIMPATPGNKYPWVVIHEHWVEVPGAGRRRIACPRASQAEDNRCLVCQRIEELRATGNDTDRAQAEGMMARPRAYIKVIDRHAPQLGVQILGIGKMIFDRLTFFRQNQDLYGADFTDPVDGCDIVIERSQGQGKQIKYSTDLRRGGQPTPLSSQTDQAVEWLEKSMDLDFNEFGKPTLVEEQRRILNPDQSGGGARSSAAPAAALPAGATTVENVMETVVDDNIPF